MCCARFRVQGFLFGVLGLEFSGWVCKPLRKAQLVIDRGSVHNATGLACSVYLVDHAGVPHKLLCDAVAMPPVDIHV